MASHLETNELEKQCTTQGAGVDTRSLCICVSTIICPAQMATEYLFFTAILWLYLQMKINLLTLNTQNVTKHPKKHH